MENGSTGPDETGFGAEDYYDIWFLDENFQPIPGIERINCSSHEIYHGKSYPETRDKAVQYVKNGQGGMSHYEPSP